MPNSVTIRREWPDSEVVTIVVEIDADYPDALDQAKVTILALLREATEIIAPSEDIEGAA
jgi:hypothetical protein